MNEQLKQLVEVLKARVIGENCFWACMNTYSGIFAVIGYYDGWMGLTTETIRMIEDVHEFGQLYIQDNMIVFGVAPDNCKEFLEKGIEWECYTNYDKSKAEIEAIA